MRRFLTTIVGVFCVVFALVGFAYGAQGKINMNTATPAELALLPGIGASIANNIVEFRQANGPFDSIDGLIKVKGIGEKKLENIREYVNRMYGKIV